jgi:hypothetical protein
MDRTWVNWIESQYNGGLKVSTLGTHTIQNLDPALAAQYGLATFANPTFLIFDDSNPKDVPQQMTGNLQDINWRSKVEETVGSWFT